MRLTCNLLQQIFCILWHISAYNCRSANGVFPDVPKFASISSRADRNHSRSSWHSQPTNSGQPLIRIKSASSRPASIYSVSLPQQHQLPPHYHDHYLPTTAHNPPAWRLLSSLLSSPYAWLYDLWQTSSPLPSGAPDERLSFVAKILVCFFISAKSR